MKLHCLLILALFSFSPSLLFSQSGELRTYCWGLLTPEENPAGRHENSFVAYEGKFYLIGGRGVNPVNVFDPITNTWETKGTSPEEVHHFQAVVFDDAIYIVGAMTGKYPNETPLEHIWIYFPGTDAWKKGPVIPEERRRGSSGCVIVDDKIYLIGGIQSGHTSGTCSWADSYDLKTGAWEALPDAPRVRDHFPAICVGGKIYCIGGRNTSVHEENDFKAFFRATIGEADYYDIKNRTWGTVKEKVPVGTAAGAVCFFRNKILYIGGESGQQKAHNETQALDVAAGTWEQLQPLDIGRHGTGAVLHENIIYTAAGSGNSGGGNMNTIEMFSSDLQWRPLFNGKNLDGWSIKSLERDKDKSHYWSADSGMITVNSIGDSTHGYIWLLHDEEFDNFELKLKFQTDKNISGNSGVQIRSRYNVNAKAEDGYWMDGPQIDIDPPTQWRTGLIYDETWEEKRWLQPGLSSSKIDKSYAPKKVIFGFDDVWNELTILCRGTRIRTFLNNIEVSDYDGKGTLDNEAHQKRNVGMKGRIALQIHKKSELKMRFKDIVIRNIFSAYGK